ncbi:MAG: translation elongation factor Ts [Planctomycetota bacterium]|jgi:elongation factor Ts
METTEESFTAKDVMALRQKTGLGMMACKKALAACSGDMAAAEEWLRQQLKGKMDARTEAGMALAKAAGTVQVDEAMTARVDDVRIATGENISFARGEKLEGGSFGSYIHHDGKRAALIQIEGTAEEELLHGLCQHIVAHVPPPVGVTEQDVPADDMERVRRDAEQEAAETGKPAEIVKKIAEGKVRKYLQQNTLLSQMYVKDPAAKTPVSKVLPQGVTVKRFIRYTVGTD